MSVIAQPECLSQPECLQQLAERLQAYLLSWSKTMPFQVHCVLHRGNLMVLSQHPPGEQLESTAIFAQLEGALQEQSELIQTLFGSDRALSDRRAKLYLRTLGQQRPYAYHECDLAKTDHQEGGAPLQPAIAPLAVVNQDQPQLEGNLDREANLDADDDLSLGQPLALDESFFADAMPAGDAAIACPTDAPDSPETPVPASEPSLLPWVIAGIGVSVVSFAAGLLVVSHTCVIGRCEPLQTAEKLHQDVEQTLKTAKSGDELGQAQARLQQANRLLGSVPPWSTHRQEAQMLLTANQADLALLERALQAEKQAGEAMPKSQTFPQSVTAWQQTLTLWRQGIAQLEAIAQGTPLYPFAQERLMVYRTNVATINRYIAAEQQAQKQLTQAKATASNAEARQGIAQTLEQWQQVQITWQDGVNSLQQIPKTTTSFTEAQERLKHYQPKLATARDRVNQELLARNAYNQATKLAQRAQTLQQQNQWTQAVQTWRDALAKLRQIPAGTSDYNRAQSLMDPYAIALQRADSQLQVAISAQRIRSDLNRVCGGSPKTCTFLILSNTIRVQLTPAYEQALKQAFSAGQTGNHQVLGGTVNHLDTLQAALQAIATNAGIPLEVYNAAGTEVVGSFNPEG